MDNKKKFTIPELQQMRESEDHVEFKKGKEATFHIMAKVKISQTKEDAVFLVM